MIITVVAVGRAASIGNFRLRSFGGIVIQPRADELKLNCSHLPSPTLSPLSCLLCYIRWMDSEGPLTPSTLLDAVRWRRSGVFLFSLPLLHSRVGR